MSILVKGVKMPRCCEVCPFNYDYYRCEALGDRFDDREEIDMETQRLPDCPLVEMPSRADVVEVVRCKDCKFWDSDCIWCELWGNTQEYGNGFCSYGERKDNE